MKKEERFDYSKYQSEPTYKNSDLFEYQFWGIHPKNGRIHVDTKRWKKACNLVGITDFMPEGLFRPRNTTYFTPFKINRYDYKINLFRDLLNELKEDWDWEYKPIFSKIKTPEEVRQNYRTNAMMHTSCVDDLDEIDIDARLESFRRIPKYNQIIQSLYCQFICKICAEVDRFILKVIIEAGYKGTDFDIKNFYGFSDGLRKTKDAVKVSSLPEYNSFRELHNINNFLKHNSRKSYETLKFYFPDSVCSVENKRSKTEYENGMFAGDWIYLKENYIDDLFNKLLRFFENYCEEYFNEDIEDSKWNYDGYFKNAVNEMKRPWLYLGLPY